MSGNGMTGLRRCPRGGLVRFVSICCLIGMLCGCPKSTPVNKTTVDTAADRDQSASAGTPTDRDGTDHAGAQLSDQQRLAILSEFNRGCALMEQYEYGKAAAVFEQIVKQIPDWPAAQFNFGLANLNLAGQSKARESLSRATSIFAQVLKNDPDNNYALFSLGMAYDYLGELDKAAKLFERVYAIAPDDLYVAHKYAESLRRKGDKDKARAILEKIVARDPGFVSSVYQLAQLYALARQRDKAMPLFDRFRALNQAELNAGAFVVKAAYGMAGKYYDVMGPDGLPLPHLDRTSSPRIIFAPDVHEIAPPRHAWDSGTGQVALPALAVADIDNDGDLDILLGASDVKGSATWWLNDGHGKFQSGARLGDRIVAPAVGDINNDGNVDVWLGCAGRNRVMLGDGTGKFALAKDVSTSGTEALTPVARLVDLDSDGDLDLLAYSWKKGDLPNGTEFQPSIGQVLISNTNGAFTDIAKEVGLQAEDAAISAVVCDDFDRDRDLDLVLFPSSAPPLGWLNHRVGRYRLLDAATTGLDVAGVYSATSGDPDKDADRDLLVFGRDGMHLFLNQGDFKFAEDTPFRDGLGKLGGTGGQFVDLDNDGDLDILIGDAHRAQGKRGLGVLINRWPERRFEALDHADPANLLTQFEWSGPASCVAADFTGNGRCDIVIAAAGEPVKLIENVTPGGNWIDLDLAGKRPGDHKARSPNSAIGARVEIKTGALYQEYVVGGQSGAVAAAPLRVHAGLGPYAKVDWLRIMWPDSVLQGELELAGNRRKEIGELNRKISSCPMLFAWNGSQFQFVADFGGVGGLGYLVEPGVYARPDPTEYIRIPRLEARHGDYVVNTITQLEEITYFDEAKLVAIDHPEGTEVYPNEMMAISVPPPAVRFYCVRDRILPQRAINHEGRDVTTQLQQLDRRYAGPTALDERFTGVAEPHAVELDFGDRLAQRTSHEPLILLLDGWVEYGYSSTNFAAHQAGVQLHAPTIDVQRNGQWVTLFAEVGYPAGINHCMTLDLSNQIKPGDRMLRIRTNMEIYWDRISLATDMGAKEIKVRERAPDVADFHDRGYPREYSPDGRQPNLYDYANLDPSVSWKLMTGQYTRFGDVRGLLQTPDDCYVIMGHGEEITMKFRADRFGPVPPGYHRTFILKTDSYCKDMDLYTAFPNTVEPLPFHGMSGYPYGPNEQYPDNPATRQYRATFNTRPVVGQ